MAIIKAVSSRANIKTALNYVMKKEKTKPELLSGINCDPTTVKEEMRATKLLWNKTGGRTYQHYVHSYAAGEKITPEQAHKNAIELTKRTKAWQGYEILVATHIDRKHIHTHIIINSVNSENGHKLQMSKKDLAELKQRCVEQSKRQGLHVPEKGKTFSGEEREETVSFKKDTFAFLKKAERGEVKSYVQDIALAIMDCRESATSRDDFIKKLKEKGVGVDWKDTHKYITFIDLNRQKNGEKKCKVRNNKLSQYYAIDFGKEALENELKSHARAAAERAATAARAREQLERSHQATNRSNRTVGAGVESAKRPEPTNIGRIEISQRKRNELTRSITEDIIRKTKLNIGSAKADVNYKRAEQENSKSRSSDTGIETKGDRQGSEYKGATTRKESTTAGNTDQEGRTIQEELRKSRVSSAAEREALEQSEIDRRKYEDAVESARANNEQRCREAELKERERQIAEQNRIIREQQEEAIRKRKKSTGRSR